MKKVIELLQREYEKQDLLIDEAFNHGQSSISVELYKIKLSRAIKILNETTVKRSEVCPECGSDSVCEWRIQLRCGNCLHKWQTEAKRN